MSNECLICGGITQESEEYHRRCSELFFGQFPPPVLDISQPDLQRYAARSVLERVTVTGVQKKLSLGIEKKGRDARFTIVGLWGNYILKPPVDEYPFLPENEAVVMRLADLLGIPTVPHGLIRLSSGELAFITRRIDRDSKGAKIAMEDFCQVSERLTEDKYKGSTERIGKLLQRYSAFPGLDAVDLLERVLFNFLVGNADMHLKNYSIIETPQGTRLAPAYDLLSTILVLPEDPEESALTINGKKARLKRGDFDALGASLQIRPRAVANIYKKLSHEKDDMLATINECRLPDSMRDTLTRLIVTRLERLR